MWAVFRRQNSQSFYRQVSLDSLVGVSAGIFLRALVDESGMIRTQMGKLNRSENGCSAWDPLYDTAP
jgi:hypothetical protein